jgi:Lar family restriction alleviation protein
MSEIKLLPCPFCGSEKLKIESKSGKIHYYEKDGMKPWQNVVFSIRCNNCHARGGTASADLPTMTRDNVKKDDAQNRAIEKWNTRKPMERIIERLDKEGQEIYREVKEAPLSPFVPTGEKEILVRNAIRIIKEEGGIE